MPRLMILSCNEDKTCEDDEEDELRQNNNRSVVGEHRRIGTIR